MKIQTIDINSKHLQRVLDLSDENIKTLGLLPYEAIREQARKNHIFGAINENDLLCGYIIFRISYQTVTIVHLCIDEKFRGLGVAKLLIDYIKEFSKPYLGIRLKCRQDYIANKVCPKFNFSPRDEVPCRSKEGHLLTLWYYSNNHLDLFTHIQETKAKDKFLVAIDMNIFLDLKNKREKETQALLSDWLIDDIELCVTHELYNEIYQSQDLKTREESRSFVNRFIQLKFDENNFEKLYSEFKNYFLLKDKNDVSDLRHITQAIIGKARYFITRDENWLEKSEFFEEKHNILILRPSTFVTHFDELMQASKYQPVKLAGSRLKIEYISKDNIDLLSNVFLYNEKKIQERKSEFSTKIREYLSYPDKYNSLIIRDNQNQLLALIVYDLTDNHKVKIPFLRFAKTPLKLTIAKHLLYSAIVKYSNQQRFAIELTDEFINPEIFSCLNDLYFVEYQNKWTRFCISGVLNLKQLQEKLNELSQFLPEYKLYTDNLLNTTNSLIAEYDKFTAYKLERLLSPLKIVELDLPCFIIPIQPRWAAELFEENITNQKLALFPPDENLVLNTQNVYYRSAKPKILEEKARILWYVSKDESHKYINGIQCITTSSYIDEIYIDKPKQLFKKFQRLGIYEWKDIYQTAKEDIENPIMSFVFSDTELFKNRISLKQLKTIYNSFTGKNFNIQSPVRIDNSLFLELYKIGNKL